MTSIILAITKKSQKRDLGISNSVACVEITIEKWSVKDFLMEFHCAASFSLYSNFQLALKSLEKEAVACLDHDDEDDAERS